MNETTKICDAFEKIASTQTVLMRPILIDTCSWLNLLTTVKFNSQLHLLENLIKDGHIELITHEQVVFEWEKNKEKVLQQRNNVIISQDRNIAKVLKESNIGSLTVKRIDETKIDKNLLEQANKIEFLIKSNAKLITASDNVKLEVIERAQKNEAPFHKGNNINDALIYYSFIEWATEAQRAHVIFVSNNTDDFSDKEDKSKLHSDLIQGSGELSLVFYNDINYAIRQLCALFSVDVPKLNVTFSKLSHDILSQQKIDELKGKHVITQLHYALTEYFKEWQFVPLDVLVSRFPFKLGDGGVLYTLHKMYINNESLYNFLKDIKIDGDSIVIPYELYGNVDQVLLEEQLKESLERLTRNLIYRVSTFRSSEANIAFIRNHKPCDCVRCLFNRLDFKGLSLVLNELPGDSSTLDRLKYAYVHFKLGNIKTAHTIYMSIIEQGLAQNLFGVHYYIAIFNLSKLENFLRNLSVHGEQVHEQLEESQKWKLESEVMQLKINEVDDYSLISNLLSTDFYYDSYRRIDIALEKIRDHYINQLRGGWSSNSNIEELVNEHEELTLYIKENFIVFEYFSEFEALSRKFVEGIFLSCAIDEKYGGSGLEALNDYMLTQMLLHGDDEHIVKLYYRYSISRFECNSLKGTAVKLIYNMLSEFVDERKYSSTLLESGNIYFEKRLSDLVQNSIVLTAIVKFEDEFIINVSKLIIKGIKKGRFKHSDQKNIILFLKKNAEILPLTIFEQFLKCLNKIHDVGVEEFIVSICNIIINTYPKYRINDDKIAKHFFYNLKGNERFLVSIAEILNSKYRRKFRAAIEKFLEVNFDEQLYYSSVIYGFHPFALHFEKYKNFCLSKAEERHLRSFWGNNEVTHKEINCLINLMYKENLPLDISEFEVVKNISEYYEWLVDPINFDYRKFDARWLAQFRTVYYTKKFKKIPQIRDALRKFLLKHKNEKLNWIFLDTYN